MQLVTFLTFYCIFTTTTIQRESGPGSNDNEAVFHTLQILRFWASPPDAVCFFFTIPRIPITKKNLYG